MLGYPARIAPQPEGGYVVSFRDVPEALTQADTLQEAREMALDALLSAMDFYLEDKRLVPAPSRKRRGEEEVRMPVVAGAKVALQNLMLQGRVRPVDLARAMQVQPQIVTRLLDLRHKTDIQTIANAFAALGKRMDLVVTAA